MPKLFKRVVDGNAVNAEIIPWDSKTFGFNVCRISSLSIQSFDTFKKIWQEFTAWSNENLVKLVSVQIESCKKNEINFLQFDNFSIMENTCKPKISNLSRFKGSEDILIEEVSKEYLPDVLNIARTSFDVSRFHSDTKIDNYYADLRYYNWVENYSPTNKVWITRQGEDIISFFLTEKIESKSYWHLTAVDNKFKGQGLGKKSWIKMLEQEDKNGTKEVETRISMENLKIVNLYSQLGAKFYNSETSLHKHI
jgi:hypothetical protein